MVTSKDIARMAGVSQATVSRVIQGRSNVSNETRKTVLKVLEETGYVANAQARAMRTQRTGTIGVITGRLTNPFYPELLDALGHHITAQRYRMALWASDSESGAEASVEAIRGQLVDGLIFTTATQESPALGHAMDMGLPVLLVNRQIDGLKCDHVTNDNVEGGRLAARHFLSADFTDVAVIGGNELISTGRDRRLGFVSEFEKHGLHIPADWQPECDFLHDAAREAARKLLTADQPPRAIFCVNDFLAFGAIDAAKSLSIRIPEDLWVIGYDDISMAAWEVFDLTTLRQRVDDMAASAVEMLAARIVDPSRVYEHRKFGAELVVRGSTARHNATS